MPSVLSKVALTVGALATGTAAHGLVSGFVTDGTYNQGFILDYYYMKQSSGSYPAVAGWYEEATDNGFVEPTAYADPDIICHKNAENGQTTATVSAGGTVDFQWSTWPDSHIGPVLTYVANCGGDCTTVDKTTLEWVKIDEAGIDLDTQEWPTAALIANNFTYSITVPTGLASGNYVFRHEIIAMHGASSENGAQNYPFCMNIAITGGGSDSPAGTLGTALYTSTDPGILFNPYTTLTEYSIPGPALYTGGTDSTGSGSGSGSGSDSGSAPTTTSAAATPTATGSSSATPTSVSASDNADDSTESDGCATRRRRRHARDVSKHL